MSHGYTPAAVAMTTITCPDDGDTRNAASVNTALEELADAILEVDERGFERVEVNSWAFDGTTPSYTDLATDPTDIFPMLHESATYTYGSADSGDQRLYCEFAGCLAGDVIVVECGGMVHYTSTEPAEEVRFKLFAKEDHGGANTYRWIPGTFRKFFTDTTVRTQLLVGGVHTVITPGPIRIEYGFKLTAADVTATAEIGFVQSFGMRATLYRGGM